MADNIPENVQTVADELNTILINYINKHSNAVRYEKTEDGYSLITIEYGKYREPGIDKIKDFINNAIYDELLVIGDMPVSCIRVTDSVMVFKGVTETINEYLADSVNEIEAGDNGTPVTIVNGIKAQFIEKISKKASILPRNHYSLYNDLKNSILDIIPIVAVSRDYFRYDIIRKAGLSFENIDETRCKINIDIEKFKKYVESNNFEFETIELLPITNNGVEKPGDAVVATLQDNSPVLVKFETVYWLKELYQNVVMPVVFINNNSEISEFIKGFNDDYISIISINKNTIIFECETADYNFDIETPLDLNEIGLYKYNLQDTKDLIYAYLYMRHSNLGQGFIGNIFSASDIITSFDDIEQHYQLNNVVIGDTNLNNFIQENFDFNEEYPFEEIPEELFIELAGYMSEYYKRTYSLSVDMGFDEVVYENNSSFMGYAAVYSLANGVNKDRIRYLSDLIPLTENDTPVVGKTYYCEHHMQM